MNEDIKALIEREAIKYADDQYEKSDIGILYNETISDFKAGAQFALSLFKWRKVSEELPKEGTIVLFKDINGKCYIGLVLDGKPMLKGGYDAEFITEWMPIPNIEEK